MRGSFNPLYLDGANYTPLMRFAVFQSEGGPVPNGSAIQSAKLQLYKQYYNDTVRLNALLKPWIETQATWQLSQTGVPWSAGGASGAGTDYTSSADAVISVPFNPGWVSFDVTHASAAVGDQYRHQFRLAARTAGGTVNAKTFNASEYSADPTLRPTLTSSISRRDWLAPAEPARRSASRARRACAS